MIGQSVPMRQLMSLIERVASSDVPVLITGESGTGKEDTAQLIHKLSSRNDGPYVPVNCAAIPETLIESQLFGHEKGAYTGADRRQQGFSRVRPAEHSSSTKLRRCDAKRRPSSSARLRSEGAAVGVRKKYPSTCGCWRRRIDQSTGRFETDIYARICTSPEGLFVHLPPLRERIEDLPFLVEHFVQRTNAEHGRRIAASMMRALTALAAYWWPGNIRELKHAIEHAVIFSESTRLASATCPRRLKRQLRPDSSFTVHLGSSMKDVVDELICRTVTYAGGNKVRAAKILGVSRRTIYSRLENSEVHETNGRVNGHPYRNGRNGLR